MTSDIFKTREKALEDQFFRKVDDELLKRMKDQLERGKQRAALASATGITDAHVLDEVIALNISSETILALWLFPLVWVAWADGHIDQQQRDDILEAAREAGHEQDSASYNMIESWLEYPPDAKLKEAWKDYVRAVCGSVSKATKQALRADIMEKLRQIAEASSFHFDFDDVEKAQHAVIAEIERSFEPE